jgi:hypothetical protein
MISYCNCYCTVIDTRDPTFNTEKNSDLLRIDVNRRCVESCVAYMTALLRNSEDSGFKQGPEDQVFSMPLEMF